MVKYSRKDINVKAQLHGERFVVHRDAVVLMMELAEKAIECGADSHKLMDYIKSINN